METTPSPPLPAAPGQEAAAETPAAPPPPDPATRLETIFAAFVRPGPTGADRSALCRFNLEGEGGGSFIVRVTPDGISREESANTVEPDITVALTVEDFLRIADGSYDGELAAKSERIVIDGDLELASVLVDLLNHGDTLGISRTAS